MLHACTTCDVQTLEEWHQANEAQLQKEWRNFEAIDIGVMRNIVFMRYSMDLKDAYDEAVEADEWDSFNQGGGNPLIVGAREVIGVKTVQKMIVEYLLRRHLRYRGVKDPMVRG
jgi:hypothetical protein